MREGIGVPTIGDLVRVVRTSPTFPGEVGYLKVRIPSTGMCLVAWLDGTSGPRIPFWDVVLESPNNLDDDEVAALMKARLKGLL